MKKIKLLLNKWVLLILCIAMVCTQANAAGIVNFNSPDNTTEQSLYDNNNTKSTETNTTENIETYYQNNKICIYNYNQLKQIGSDAYVYTGDKDGSIGSGEVVKNEGTELRYTSEAQYVLMNDIEMSTDYIWTLPNNFTGSITGTTRESTSLYNKETDTITLYNPYQLMVLAQDNSENEPVMSLDYDAPQFGMGQMIYPNGENQPYLTYSKSHKYVLSQSFDSSKPELTADQVRENVGTENAEGRDFKGQVVKTIGDKTYILIGNEAQLREIGTNKPVYGAVYQAYLDVVTWKVDKDKSGNPIMLYGGDADLKKNQNGVFDYTFGEIKSKDKSLSKFGIYERGRCGVNQTTGEIDPNLDIDKAANQKYSANANYIIFRDIDLSSSNWKPLNFQGTMVGAKSTDQRIWDAGAKIEKPVISNVKVLQEGELDVGVQMGVGFFSTLSDEASANDVGLSKGTVLVSNLVFKNIDVDNQSTKTKYDQTLVNGLVSGLGSLLGGVLDLLTWLLTFGSVDAGLRKTLTDVLDARKKDPTALATGSLVGRVVGNVEISGCEMKGSVSVKSSNNYTGGFVGYTTGKTQYEGLSNALGATTKLLAGLLNLIPGLGLGDLITILLGNAIPLSKLIPTGYINAKIKNCSINGLSISTANEKDYAGGFIGQQKGTIVEGCTITNSDYTISGKSFVGGFVGLARDDVIEGTLSGALDIETKLPHMNPESLLLNCSINNKGLIVTSETYAGGFAGGLANTAAVNCTVKSTNRLEVSATGNNAGGFAGIASLGWAADLGKGDTENNLLGGVVGLLEGLLSSNKDASSLLSLAGVNPSYILGANINGPLKLSGADYVGGITGRGNGAYIASSSADYLNKVSYWRNKIYDTASVPVKDVELSNVQSITGKNYVGGIAGSLGTANKETVSIGEVVKYTVTGSVQDTTGYEQYVYTIHDELSKGLDFVKNANGDALDNANEVNVKVAFKDTGLTVGGTTPTTATLSGDNKRTMALDLSAWVRANQTNKGKEFTVTYYAKVNKDAVVTEKNSATLEYGNNPGDTTTTTPSEEKTPTYPLDINKIKKGSDEKLAGAKFRLYSSEVDANANDESKAIKVSPVVAGVAGNYVVDPTSDNTVFESVASIEGQGYNLRVNGLAAGTYYLVETEAPAGYNKLTDPIKVEIKKSTNEDVNAWTLFNNNENVDDKIIDVENSTGSILPSTGGMGTIAFTVVAALLVLGVAVSFIRDRKKEN